MKYYVGIEIVKVAKSSIFYSTFLHALVVLVEMRDFRSFVSFARNKEREILIKTFVRCFRSREGRRDAVVPPPARETFRAGSTKIAPQPPSAHRYASVMILSSHF